MDAVRRRKTEPIRHMGALVLERGIAVSQKGKLRERPIHHVGACMFHVGAFMLGRG